MQVQTDTFSRRVQGRGIGDDTYTEYLRWVKRFGEWTNEEGYTDIGVGTLIEYDEALMDPPAAGVEHRETPYAYRTRAVALSAVKKYVEVVEGVDIDSDIDDIVKGEPSEFDPYIYETDQIEQALTEECDCGGCLAARNLGYETVMRAAEVTRVRPKDLDYDNQTVYVRGVKGSENRHMEVPDQTWELVAEQHGRVEERFDDPAKLFYDTTDSSGWSPNGWSEHYRRNHAPNVPGENTGFHSFARHTRITRLLQSGADFGEVYIKARHSNPQMTQRYVQVAGVGTPDDGLFSE